MSLTILRETQEQSIGASLFVPRSPEKLYEVVRDVRGFPAWASGVRRVTVVGGPSGSGMVSEWEVSFLGIGMKVRSVLEKDEPPWYLRWSYDGPLRGWGECELSPLGGGVLAEFRTELRLREPALGRLARSSAARGAAASHLKRCLTRLGRTVAADDFRVGPLRTPGACRPVAVRSSLAAS